MLSTFVFDDSQFKVWPLLPLNFQVCSVRRRHGGWKLWPGVRSEVCCFAYMPYVLSAEF